jgi:hypothetical protein
MTPAELLKAAAANITDETWCQHSIWDGARACASGHIARAMGFNRRAGEAKDEPIWQATMPLLRVAMGGDAGDDTAIPSWNDTPGRTFEEVKALFLRVAEELEAGGEGVQG